MMEECAPKVLNFCHHETDGQTYFFIFDRESLPALAAVLDRYVKDPELNLKSEDAEEVKLSAAVTCSLPVFFDL